MNNDGNSGEGSKNITIDHKIEEKNDKIFKKGEIIDLEEVGINASILNAEWNISESG